MIDLDKIAPRPNKKAATPPEAPPEVPPEAPAPPPEAPPAPPVPSPEEEMEKMAQKMRAQGKDPHEIATKLKAMARESTMVSLDDVDIDAMVPKTPPEPPAPNIQPPDVEEDRAHVPFEDILVDAFDWSKVDGVGPTKVQAMLMAFDDKGIRTMGEAREFDFSKIPGFGPSTAKKVIAVLEGSQDFVPEGLEEDGDGDDDGEDDPMGTEYMADDEDDEQLDLKTPEAPPEPTEFADTVQSVADQAKEGQPPHSPVPSSRKAHVHEAKGTLSPVETKSEIRPPEVKEAAPAQTVLCVNVIPVAPHRSKAPKYVFLDDLLEPLKKEVCEELGVTYWDENGFAEGGKLLAAKVLINIDMFKGKTMIAFESQPEISRIVQVLQGSCDLVYRAVQ